MPPPTCEGRQGVRSRGAHCRRFVRPGPASTLHSDRRRRDKGCRISAAAEMDVKGHRESEGLVGQARTGEPPNRRRGTKSRGGDGTAGGPPRRRARLHSKSCTHHTSTSSYGSASRSENKVWELAQTTPGQILGHQQQHARHGTAQRTLPDMQGGGPYTGTKPCNLPDLTLPHLP